MGRKEIKTINGFQIMGLGPGIARNPFRALTKILKKKGPIVKFSLFKKETLYLTADPAFMKHLLKDNADNYHRNPAIIALQPWLGEGIFLANGDWWLHQHRLMSPALKPKMYQNYYDGVATSLERLKKRWSKFSENEKTFDLANEMERLMLEITMSTLFHQDLKYDTDELLEHHHNLISLSSPKGVILGSIRKHAMGVFGKAPKLGKSYRKSLGYFDELFEKMKRSAKDSSEGTGLILSLLLSAESRGDINMRQVQDEVANLIFAGFDTTAAGLTWTSHLLWSHPQELEKVRTFKAKENEPNYLAAVIKEGLRLYPPVWGYPRVAKEDDQVGDYAIPKRASVWLCPWILHRDEKYWKNANAFIPNRFHNQPDPVREFIYLPFGQGKRICIGNKMAQLEMEQVLSFITKHFDLVLIQKNPGVRPEIIIKPNKKMMVRCRSVSNDPH